MLGRYVRLGRRFPELFVAKVGSLAIVRGSAHTDPVAPSSHRAPVVVALPTMDDEKYLLANIGNVRACHAEPAQHAPDEGTRVGENMVEIELGGEQNQGRERFYLEYWTTGLELINQSSKTAPRLKPKPMADMRNNASLPSAVVVSK